MQGRQQVYSRRSTAPFAQSHTRPVEPIDESTLKLWEFRVFTRSMDAAVARCMSVIADRRSGAALRPAMLTLALNPEKVVRARQDGELADALSRAGLLIPDGVGISLAALVLRGRRVRRIPGADLMPQLCEAAAQNGYRVFLYGARPEVNERAERALKQRFPTLIIAGRVHGYVDDEGPESAAAQIAATAPDIVFVALGSPRQERWMVSHAASLPVAIVQGVGGTFDVLAGSVHRAPRPFRAAGLEWLYRLASDPRRWRRQLALLTFLRWVARSRLGLMRATD